MKSSLFTIKSGGAASWAIRIVVAVGLGYVLLWIPTAGSDSLIDQCTTALTLMAAALSLNLLLGYTGQISIGHSAFFGIGTYTTAVMVTRWHWSPFLTMPVAFALAFAVGVLVSLPALRIKGVYLALVTLALGLVFPQFIKWKKIAWLTGGAKGLDKTGFKFSKDNPTYEIVGWNPWGNLRGENVKPFYYWVGVVIVVIVYLICRGVVKSRMGRSLVAVRDNSTAAAVMGVNLAVTKGIVFGLSAAMCALPGCLSGMRTGNVTPDTQLLTVSGAIIFLVIMVVGGAGSLWG
ncbi:MAG: branched-chain amino acid ABC transporter permease, partial [Ilumatobacteraceae bacterium]